ncbi:MAG: M23 family metallopeptidase [Leptospirales bacterium]|nr:M23 family metallopeptidase [Leptospirales bacterium]
MKKLTAILLTLSFWPVLAHSKGIVNQQKNRQQTAVQEQRATDAKNKAELIKQMKQYLGEINKILADDETELVIPLDPDNIEDIDDIYSFHDKQDIPNDYIIPADGKISSQYGTRNDPLSNKKKFHAGIDIAAKKGTPVYASSSGEVKTSTFNNNGYGNLIVIEHGNAITTWYGHLDERLVKINQKVKKGELIGKVGSTGRSTGPHLHFEIRKGADSLDPEKFFGK